MEEKLNRLIKMGWEFSIKWEKGEYKFMTWKTPSKFSEFRSAVPSFFGKTFGEVWNKFIDFLGEDD